MSFDITPSKSLVTRSLRPRTASSTLCGFLFLTALANVAVAADTKIAIENVLNDAISQTQNMIVSMSQGCSGGASGVPPFNWGSLQKHGYSAVDALNAIKLALATNETVDAIQQLDAAGRELDALVNGVHNNCSGGASGEDPVYYGRYQAVRAD
jgi:hypothetical protein